MGKWFKATNSLDDATKQWKALLRKHHPDVNKSPDATAVTQEINAEYAGIKRMYNGEDAGGDWYRNQGRTAPRYTDPYGGFGSGFAADFWADLGRKMREAEEKRRADEKKAHEETRQKWAGTSEPKWTNYAQRPPQYTYQNYAQGQWKTQEDPPNVPPPEKNWKKRNNLRDIPADVRVRLNRVYGELTHEFHDITGDIDEDDAKVYASDKVKGATYRQKELLKAHGFRWNEPKKTWYCDCGDPNPKRQAFEEDRYGPKQPEPKGDE